MCIDNALPLSSCGSLFNFQTLKDKNLTRYLITWLEAARSLLINWVYIRSVFLYSSVKPYFHGYNYTAIYACPQSFYASASVLGGVIMFFWIHSWEQCVVGSEWFGLWFFSDQSTWSVYLNWCLRLSQLNLPCWQMSTYANLRVFFSLMKSIFDKTLVSGIPKIWD